MMAFDAFISYANRDKATADATCAALESAGIRCWIAPRDIAPGADWGAAIIEALETCRLFVLIFSSNADASPQVRNEIVKAASRGIVIVPIRIEDTIPTKSLAYYMGGVHWLDALTPPLESHLHVLVATVTALLKLDPSKTDAPGDAHQASQVERTVAAKTGGLMAKRWASARSLRLAGAILLAVVFVSTATIVLWRFLGPGTYSHNSDDDPTAASFSIIPPHTLATGVKIVVTTPSGRQMTCIGGNGAIEPRRCNWN
jgi:TIR domain